jgi:5-methylcytosine-specific restriction endonuclease McrA
MTVDEHLVPLFSGGPNELSNRAIWCVDCAKAKTAGEAPGRAKVRRFEQKKTQADKRKAAGGSRWPKGRKMQSRPFQGKKA